MGFPGGTAVKNPPTTWVRSLGHEDPLEKEMITYSSILAWRIPWTEDSFHGVAKSRTRRKQLSMPVHMYMCIHTHIYIHTHKYTYKLPIQAAAATAAKSLQSCSTLCDPIDGSPPGSAIPGILQARTLEWVSISFSNA